LGQTGTKKFCDEIKKGLDSETTGLSDLPVGQVNLFCSAGAERSAASFLVQTAHWKSELDRGAMMTKARCRLLGLLSVDRRLLFTVSRSIFSP
jgi:hypothetical protein